MSKPIIASISPFDSALGTVITFSYMGNQPYRNKLIIRDAETLQVVQEDIEVTLKLQHTIQPNVLTNGKKYTAEIICIDNAGNESPVSEKSFFWVFSTPTFTLNVTDGETVKSSSLVANVFYSQTEDEKLAQTQFYLYDANKTTINSSKVISGSENISYTYSGFNNLTIYYVRAIGITANGMDIDTGYIQIFVKFENPSSYAMIYANQDPNGTGTVNYFTNLSIIRPVREDYTLINGYVDLTTDTLTYNRGFEIADDFTFAIKHRYMNGKLFEMTNGDQTIELYMINQDGEIRYKLVADGYYKIYSSPIVGAFDDNMEDFTVYIRKVNNIYGLTMYYDYEYLLSGYDVWYSNTQPTDAHKLNVWVDGGNNNYSVQENTVVTDTEPTTAPKDTLWIGG